MLTCILMPMAAGRARARLKRLLADRSGVAAVEFALTLPLVLLTVFGIIEFGITIFTYGVVNYAAEQATRYATVNYSASTSQIEAVAKDSFILIDPANIVDFSVTAPYDATDQTRLVTVKIGYRHVFSLPYVDLGSIIVRGDSKGFIVED